MDVHSFNKKLNKISALADNGSVDGQFSSLERDLLLSYIRELYDIAIDGKPLVVKSVSQSPILAKSEDVIPTKSESPSAALHVQALEPIPIKAEKVEDPVVVSSVSEKKETIPSVVEVMKVTAQAPTTKTQNPDALSELFAEEKINDLSDKLASSPVKDLTKSMGINERIFTQQELFGNNQQVFNETLQRLNVCQNFGEAKQYLVENVIDHYDWTNENKVKKATTFIKYVKRKFA